MPYTDESDAWARPGRADSTSTPDELQCHLRESPKGFHQSRLATTIVVMDCTLSTHGLCVAVDQASQHLRHGDIMK